MGYPGRDSNARLLAPEANALSTELPGRDLPIVAHPTGAVKTVEAAGNTVTWAPNLSAEESAVPPWADRPRNLLNPIADRQGLTDHSA